MSAKSAKIWMVMENDRMYGKRKVVAAHVDHEMAVRIQAIGYLIADSWLQFSIDKEN